jgi:hypothetical protein
MSKDHKKSAMDDSAIQPKAAPPVDGPRTEPAPIQPQISQNGQPAPATPERKVD